MSINYKAVSKALGIVITISGLSMLPALITAFLYNEPQMVKAFCISMIPAILLGGGIFFISKTSPDKTLKRREAILIVATAWISVCIIGSLPYIMSDYVTGFANAFFESVSGFTTTGASVIEDVESLPRSLLFWRSFTNWLGGMGIILIAVSILPTIGAGSHIISETESSGSLQERFMPKAKDMVKYLYLLYLALSLLLFILLILGGLTVFDSLIHMFGTVSTGGFSSYNDGISNFDSAYITWVITVFMILGAVNFVLYYYLFSKHRGYFYKDEELRWFLVIIFVAAFSMIIYQLTSVTGLSIAETVRESVFSVASTITTTGYSIADTNLWHTFPKMIIIILIVIGGCSGSSAGGIKIWRTIILTKLLGRNVQRRLHPTAVEMIKLDSRPAPVDMVTGVVGFIMFYIAIIVCGTLLISIGGHDMITNLTAVMACVSNVGPGFELVGPTDTFAFFDTASKSVFSFLMLAGRLEIYTLLLLFTPVFWSPNR